MYRRPQNYYVEESDQLKYPDEILDVYMQIMEFVDSWNTKWGSTCENCGKIKHITMSGKVLGHFIKLEHDDSGEWACGDYKLLN
jgi:hypothetical protein